MLRDGRTHVCDTPTIEVEAMTRSESVDNGWMVSVRCGMSGC